MVSARQFDKFAVGERGGESRSRSRKVTIAYTDQNGAGDLGKILCSESGSWRSFQNRSKRNRIVVALPSVPTEELGDVVVFGSRTFDSRNETCRLFRVVRLEQAVTDTCEHESTEPVGFIRCEAEGRHGAERKGDRDARFVWKLRREVRAQSCIRLGIMGLVGFAMSKEVDADDLVARVAQNVDDPRFLPRLFVRATPAVNENDGISIHVA